MSDKTSLQLRVATEALASLIERADMLSDPRLSSSRTRIAERYRAMRPHYLETLAALTAQLAAQDRPAPICTADQNDSN